MCISMQLLCASERESCVNESFSVLQDLAKAPCICVSSRPMSLSTLALFYNVDIGIDIKYHKMITGGNALKGKCQNMAKENVKNARETEESETLRRDFNDKDSNTTNSVKPVKIQM